MQRRTFLNVLAALVPGLAWQPGRAGADAPAPLEDLPKWLKRHLILRTHAEYGYSTLTTFEAWEKPLLVVKKRIYRDHKRTGEVLLRFDLSRCDPYVELRDQAFEWEMWLRTSELKNAGVSMRIIYDLDRAKIDGDWVPVDTWQLEADPSYRDELHGLKLRLADAIQQCGGQPRPPAAPSPAARKKPAK
jgi:hypothetical protein